MLCLPRRIVAALLWIAIAILPLRGFAAVMMPMFMPSSPASVASAPADATARVMPCHGATAEDSGTPAGASHTCSLCDLCHGTVAQFVQPSVALPATHDVRPDAATPSVLEPRAPDSLFRPPRISLA